jgi:hypothetical protein
MVVFAGLGMANLYDVPLRKEAVVGLIILTAAMLASMADADATIPQPPAAADQGDNVTRKYAVSDPPFPSETMAIRV